MNQKIQSCVKTDPRGAYPQADESYRHILYPQDHHQHHRLLLPHLLLPVGWQWTACLPSVRYSLCSMFIISNCIWHTSRVYLLSCTSVSYLITQGTSLDCPQQSHVCSLYVTSFFPLEDPQFSASSFHISVRRRCYVLFLPSYSIYSSHVSRVLHDPSFSQESRYINTLHR